MGLHVVQQPDVEADDIIASMARKVTSADHRVSVVIVSADKDFAQCVNGRVQLLQPRAPCKSKTEQSTCGVCRKQFGTSRSPDLYSVRYLHPK